MCTKDTINASVWATDMGYAIALKITDIKFPDLVQIHLFVFCQSGPPKPTRPLTLNEEKNWYGLNIQTVLISSNNNFVLVNSYTLYLTGPNEVILK